MQRILARVTERRVAEIMRERDRLCQLLVQAQGARDRPSDLRHLDRVGQAGAEIIAFVFDKDLRLVFQPPKRARMDDAVTVPLERGAEMALFFGVKTSACFRRIGRKRRTHVICPALLCLPRTSIFETRCNL